MTKDYLEALMGAFCTVGTFVALLVFFFSAFVWPGWARDTPPSRNRELRSRSLKRLRRARSDRWIPLTITSRDMALAEGFRKIGRAHPRFGELWRITDYGSRSGMTRLRVNRGTSSETWLPVPPDVETPREAAAWTYDIAPSEFDPDRT